MASENSRQIASRLQTGAEQRKRGADLEPAAGSQLIRSFTGLTHDTDTKLQATFVFSVCEVFSGATCPPTARVRGDSLRPDLRLRRLQAGPEFLSGTSD